MEGTTPAPVVTEQPAQQQGNPEHHINRQPRDFSGRVNGAPRPGGPPAPKPEGQGADARQPGETAAEHQQRIKFKWTKSRATGEEVEEEATLDDVARWRSSHHTMHAKFEEASKLRKEAEQIQRDFEDGLTKPDAFRKMLEANLRKQGMDARAAREQVRETLAMTLAGLLDEDDLSPEQRELRELREREAARAREEEEAEATTRLEQHKESVRQKAAVWAEKIGGALKAAKDGGLPVTDSAIRAMSGHLSASMRHGVGCTEAELVEVYREDLRQNTGATIAAMDFADIRRLFPDVVKKIHAGLRAEAQQKKPGAIRSQPGAPSSPRPTPEEPIRIASGDFEAYQQAVNSLRGRG